MQHAITEHLGNPRVYKRLTKNEAVFKQQCIVAQIRAFVTQHDIKEGEGSWLYKKSKVNYNATLPKFRMTIKCHKNPEKYRPIVCCAGILLNDLSIWLDFHRKKLLHLLSCYLHDSNDLLRKLRELGTLPPGAKLFSTDANSMYTNIGFDHAIEEITLWFRRLEYDGRLPAQFPTKVRVAHSND